MCASMDNLLLHRKGMVADLLNQEAAGKERRLMVKLRTNDFPHKAGLGIASVSLNFCSSNCKIDETQNTEINVHDVPMHIIQQIDIMTVPKDMESLAASTVIEGEAEEEARQNCRSLLFVLHAYNEFNRQVRSMNASSWHGIVRPPME
ncbi:hypothetical protein Nepgr_004660 [Nepenthes gracilis]|uniref:Uncharacterized protein n=1 Tax=Nepenthes gracilis TaxID=150966 RepID=A0AAD3XFM5_NEPGR|nr:hypothetical protein Nepgr_004660 [Nepenthes gracilis]